MNNRIQYIINRLNDDKKIGVLLAELNEIIRLGYKPRIVNMLQSNRMTVYDIKLK